MSLPNLLRTQSAHTHGSLIWRANWVYDIQKIHEADEIMSAESYLDEKSRSLSLSVEIPSTCMDPGSSVESSLNPSPTGILESRSTSASTSSLPTLNVTFAPLPQLAPRKRRSTAPLGMAARGQLMRRRREYIDQTYANNPMWTDEELAEQQRVAIERRRLEEEDGEDPFVTLGKLVKVASKSIWRKVSQKDLSKKRKADEEAEAEQKKSASLDGKVEPSEVHTESREILGTITQNGDDRTLGVETDKEKRFLTVGQTETIVEGHTKYSWINGSLEGSERDSTTEDDDSVAPVTSDPPTLQAASTATST